MDKLFCSKLQIAFDVQETLDGSLLNLKVLIQGFKPFCSAVNLFEALLRGRFLRRFYAFQVLSKAKDLKLKLFLQRDAFMKTFFQLFHL